MTVVFIDSVIGAALVHLGLPILPGLPCPTCRGSGGSLGPNEWQGWRPCPDCNGSGVWTPPDHPVTIGVTSAEPSLRSDIVPGYGAIRASQDDPTIMLITNRGEPIGPIVLSSVIGEGTLRKLKVVEADADGHGAVVEMRPDGSLWFWPEGAFGEDAATDISSALPFLPGLKPGDTVYLLDGFTESVECDGGRCGLSHRGCYPGDTSWCSSCDQMIPTERNGRFVTHWHRPMRRPCPFPVAAPDHPCVQP